MPPYLAAPHYHLSRLPVTTKAALTMFYLSMLAAIAFTGLTLYPERTGYTTRGAEVNFMGTEHLQEQGVIVEQEVAGKTKRQLYDIVHPHAFMMPVIFFILCHLMEMCYAPKAVKLALYIGGGLSMLAVTFAPLIVPAWLGSAALLGPAVAVLIVSFSAMIVVPAVQMWARPK